MLFLKIIFHHKSIFKPTSVRNVGIDWLNKSGKYKFEDPKKPVSDYPENIEVQELKAMLFN